ncbi:hypothetical protein RZ760_012160 [Providencia rettgeri]|nr:hypothetical protein [Providencia rettgeri]
MNVKNKRLEKTCSDFKKYFSHHFDWNNIDLSFVSVDTKNKKLNTITTNYDWLLTCWDDDLDLLIKERLASGIQYWDNYSSAYSDTFSKNNKNFFKVDFCHQHDDIFNIISINTNKHLSVTETLATYKYKPIIAHYAQRIWLKNVEAELPLRAEISLPSINKQEAEKGAVELLDIHQYMRFGNIRFTRKEIITIRLLLSQCRVKEISYIQGCSEASEHKRIQNIKDKLGCSHASSSGLFKALKEHGVTLACLGVFANF